MGQKNSKNNKKLKKSESSTNIKNKSKNIFTDTDNYMEEFERIKVGNKITQICPNCNKLYPTISSMEIKTYVKHRRECKNPSNTQNENNTINHRKTLTTNNYIYNNTINNTINNNRTTLNQSINNIINPSRTQNNNIINIPPPPPQNNSISQFDERKQCPNCKIMYKYNTPYYRSLYNQHIIRCRPTSSIYSYNNYNSNRDLPSVNRPIKVNSYNQGLNNVLDAFGFEKKKVLPRGKKDGTFEEKVDYLRFDISKKKLIL